MHIPLILTALTLGPVSATACEGPDTEYRLQEFSARECYEINGRKEPLCTLDRSSERCAISSTHVKWCSSVQLLCLHRVPTEVMEGAPARDQESICFEKEFNATQPGKESKFGSKKWLIFAITVVSAVFVAVFWKIKEIKNCLDRKNHRPVRKEECGSTRARPECGAGQRTGPSGTPHSV